MTDLEDLLELIHAWRNYRAMATMDGMPQKHYQRLADDFALVIRRRLGRREGVVADEMVNA